MKREKKVLGINKTYASLKSKNYRKLQREIKENIIKCPQIGRLKNVKIAVLSKFVYNFSIITLTFQ